MLGLSSPKETSLDFKSKQAKESIGKTTQLNEQNIAGLFHEFNIKLY